jgi:hypothetical protein
MDVNKKFLLCWLLAYLDNADSWKRLGRRKLQLELSRVCGPNVSASLKTFCRNEIINRNERRPLDDSYRYRINHAFAESDNGKLWRALSDVLFSPNNKWRELFERPSVGHGYLNPSGMLVLGSIVAAEIGVSTGELQQYLRELVGERTVRNCVRYLLSEGLIFRDSKELLNPAHDLNAKLTIYELEVGAKQRADRNFEVVANQRDAFFGYRYLLEEEN